MAGDYVPDNGPLITGALWFICLICLPFPVARTYVRITRVKNLWWDDWALILPWVCLLGETAFMQVAITYGFGKYLRDIPNRRNIITMVIWGQVGLTFIAFAASLSKISFGITLLRLTSGKWKALVWSTSVTISVLAVPAAVISWVQCQPFEKGLDRPIPGTCFSTNIPQHYGMFMAGWNALMDFILARIPWTVPWHLNMNLPEKIGISVCMSLGAFTGVVSIIKATYITQFISADFSYDGVDITCWSAAEAEAALIATSIPVLRAFVRDKATSGGGYGSRGVDQVPLSRIGASRTEATGSRKAGNDIWVSAHGGRSGDADSDKSILREEQQGFPESGILQTNIFMIDTQSDAESAGRRGS